MRFENQIRQEQAPALQSKSLAKCEAFYMHIQINTFVDMLPYGNSIFLLSQNRYVFPSVKLDMI